MQYNIMVILQRERKKIMEIDYKKITFKEFELLSFFHINFDFICDADRKVIRLEHNDEQLR